MSTEDRMTSCKAALKVFLNEKGWHECRCGTCSATFFSKWKERHSCGWRKCGDWEKSIATLPRRKKSVSPAHVQETLARQFTSIGYRLAQPRNVADALGSTDLVVAGVQMFDDLIHKGAAIPPGKYLIGQPCIRMQFQKMVETREGFSTSFVNTCTEEAGGTFEDHLTALDAWFGALSKIGLHMNDTTLVVRVSDDNWGTGLFSALEIFFSYAGLEIGDAAFMFVPRAGQEPISVSDIGFGLERLAWVVNRNMSYFGLLLPWSYDGSREMADLVRTAALLALCGVTPSNKGAGFQLRKLAKLLGARYRGHDWQTLVPHYFSHWAQFIEPSVSEADTVRCVRLEGERELNSLICERLGAQPPRVETTEEYATRLVYTSGIDIHALRETIQACRKTT